MINSHGKTDSVENETAARQWFRDIAPLLFLVDVGLMFSSTYFKNVGADWVFIVFLIAATSYAMFVLFLASRAARSIPASIPFQRQMGTMLYLSAHLLQFAFPGQLPLALAGYVLLAVPISIVFLFAQ